MLEEFRRHVLIRGVALGERECHLEQVLAVHRHPRRAVGLLDVHVERKMRAIERTDVVEPEKAALEDVVPLAVLAVHPPGEVQQELVEDALEEGQVLAAIDLEHLQRGPRMHRRVDVPERPLVGRQLAVGMHVPLTTEQDQLGLRELGVDPRQGDAVEGEVPRRVPRVLPFVRHRDDIPVVKVLPAGIAAGQPRVGRFGACRIAREPAMNVVVIELLRPQHPAQRLSKHHGFIGRCAGRGEVGIELVRLLLALRHDLVETGARLAILAQPQADDGSLARADRQVVPERRLRALMLRVDCRKSMNDVVVDAILGITAATT